MTTFITEIFKDYVIFPFLFYLSASFNTSLYELIWYTLTWIDSFVLQSCIFMLIFFTVIRVHAFLVTVCVFIWLHTKIFLKRVTFVSL